jgi:hypothetical protein
MNERKRSTRRPTLCLDFDGVLHAYTSGWKGAEIIPDEPVPGALEFLDLARKHFKLAIYSSRSAYPTGIKWMQVWLRDYLLDAFGMDKADDIMDDIDWPTSKPSAFLTIDDRALTFTGTWPSIKELLAFKPWNK